MTGHHDPLLQPHPHPYADVAELLELGVLQEANRRFFHILGLELVVRVGESGEHTLSIIDGREDDGGLIFRHPEESWSEIRRERVNRVGEMWERCVAARSDRYGFERQPVADL